MLHPLNDYALVEIIDEAQVYDLEVQRGEYEGAQKGCVVEVGSVKYISTNAWVQPIDWPVDDPKCYGELVGKVIYWEKFTDNNATVEHDGKKFAFIKLAKITGFEE